MMRKILILLFKIVDYVINAKLHLLTPDGEVDQIPVQSTTFTEIFPQMSHILTCPAGPRISPDSLEKSCNDKFSKTNGSLTMSPSLGFRSHDQQSLSCPPSNASNVQVNLLFLYLQSNPCNKIFQVILGRFSSREQRIETML